MKIQVDWQSFRKKYEKPKKANSQQEQGFIKVFKEKARVYPW